MEKEPDKCFDDIQSISILFRDDTSHANVINQFVSKLTKADFAPADEIIEHLKMTDILIK